MFWGIFGRAERIIVFCLLTSWPFWLTVYGYERSGTRAIQRPAMQADVRPDRAMHGRHRPDMAKSGPKLAEADPNSAGFVRFRATYADSIDPQRPMWSRIGRIGGSVLERFVSEFNHIRPNSARHPPTSAEIGQIQVHLPRSTTGRTRGQLDTMRPRVM